MEDDKQDVVMASFNVQVILITHVFAYPWSYFSIMSINILSMAKF
jgi:hypothetical protein